MLARLGLPSPQIATKLYGTIALFLALICALAGAMIHFAVHTGEAANRFRDDNVGSMVLATHVEVLIEQHRRLVAVAPFASDATRQSDEQAYRELSARIGGLLERAELFRAAKLHTRFAMLNSYGAAVFDLARAQEREKAIAAAARYATAAEDLGRDVVGERQRRVAVAERGLESLAANARSLVTWVCAAAAVTGLLIGPLGLLLLRRVLSRLQGIASALFRLARNDTSVDIPGLADQDEVGQLARSLSVFKAKSIELLQKKGELERLNLQLDAAISNMPLGLSMFDAQERLLVCNKRYAEMYQLPSELTLPGRCIARSGSTAPSSAPGTRSAPPSVPTARSSRHP
jgi:PAS domain-containing protein